MNTDFFRNFVVITEKHWRKSFSDFSNFLKMRIRPKGAMSCAGVIAGLLHTRNRKGNGKLRAYAMKRVAAGAHVPTLWLFEHAKRADDRANYCLDSSFLRSSTMYSFLQLSGVGRALWVNSGEGSARWAF